MKFYVDSDLCIGCGICSDLCEDVFIMVDDKSVVKMHPVTEEFQSKALVAEDACPVNCITHE